MPLPLTDHMSAPTGEFLLQVFRRSVLIETYEDKNLIVDNSKFIHAKLLGGTVANNSVTTVSFGTNGTAPAAGNTSITGAFSKAVDSVSYPAANKVTFNITLASGEANGMAIIEFGLFTAGALLYARKVRTAALNKESDLSLAIAWTINF